MSREKANDRIDGQISSLKRKSNKSVIITFVVLAIVIVLLVGVVMVLVLGKESKVYNTVVTPDNVEEMISQLNDTDIVPIGSYETIMNTDWTFADGTSASKDAYVKNAETNRNTVYFTIALTDEPDKQIYESPLIPVGSYIENISLEGAIMEPGIYDAVLTYHLLDADNEEESTVSVSITITIEM